MKKLLVLIIMFALIVTPTFGETLPNKIYFNKQAVEPIVQLINNAQKNIHIEMFGFTNYKPVIEALVLAGQRGVEIEIILDNQGSNNPENVDKAGNITGCPESLLESAGAVVKWDKRAYLMHRKIMLVDEEVLFMGSTNYTGGGFDKNREVDLCIVDKEVGKQILDQFSEDWLATVDTFDEKKDEEPPDEPTPPTPEPPAKTLIPPINLKAKYATMNVILEWETDPASLVADGFNIYRAKGDEIFGITPINLKPMKNKSYTDSNTKPGYTYKYRVTALDKDNKETEPSSEVSIETPIKLNSVKNLKAIKDGNSIILTWDSEQPVGFIVKRGSVELVRTTDKTYSDTNPPYELITYRVLAYKGADVGASAQVVIDNSKQKENPPDPEKEVKYIGNSNTKKFHCPSCRSVKDIKQSNKVEFYSREEAISGGYSPCGICKP